MRILLAIDGSPYSDAAVDEVAQRPWAPGSEILVITAFEVAWSATPDVWALPPQYYAECERVVQMHAHSVQETAIAKIRKALGENVTVTGKTVAGSPKHVIVAEAEKWQPDLIMVGSHGYPTWERLLLGSVSQAVVTHAKCSVEVVRRH